MIKRAVYLIYWAGKVFSVFANGEKCILPDKAYGGKKTLYFGYNQKYYNISWPNKVYFGKKK